MASKAEQNQIFVEEYSRIDQEVKEIQKELIDVLNLNDELAKNIQMKEEELITKEKRLESLKERNTIDEEQLDLETVTLTEKYNHEIAIGEDRLKVLDMQHKRYLDIQNENQSLKESISILQDILEKSRLAHAEKMHTKNLEMKELRESMEKKMRDQLNQMDNSYQKDAFIALSENHKKAMFQNSKLKDEVALQGVGLNNLGSRLAKQTVQYQQCLDELHHLNKKSAKLRKSLADISLQKTATLKETDTVLRSRELLLKEKEDLRYKLNQFLNIKEYIKQQKQVEIEIIDKTCDVIMWKERLNRLYNLELDIKPTSELEEIGRFDHNVFSLEASQYLYSTIATSQPYVASKELKLKDKDSKLNKHNIRVHQLDNKVNNNIVIENQKKDSTTTTLNTNTKIIQQQFEKNIVKMSIKPSELEAFLKKDALLADALSHLKGKEGIILVPRQDQEGIILDRSKNNIDINQHNNNNNQEMKEQNMVQWIVLQILNLWITSEMNAKLLKEKKLNQYENIQNDINAKSDLILFVNNNTNFATTNINTTTTNNNKEKDELEDPMIEGSIVLPLLNLSILNHDHNKSNKLSEMIDDNTNIMSSNTNIELNVPNTNHLDPHSLEYKQLERDWIENGELDEKALEDIWDDSFNAIIDNQQLKQSKNISITSSWLKNIPNPKKLPISTYHLDSKDLINNIDINHNNIDINHNNIDINHNNIDINHNNITKEDRKYEINVNKITSAPPIVIDKIPAIISNKNLILPKIQNIYNNINELSYHKVLDISLDPLENVVINDPLISSTTTQLLKKKTMKLSKSHDYIHTSNNYKSSDLKNNMKKTHRMSTNSINKVNNL